MARFFSLQSGSSGNCYFAGTASSGVLIDAGAGVRTVLAGLCAHGIPREAIRGVFITHEHSDHIKSLAALLRYFPVPVFGSEITLQKLADEQKLPGHARTVAVADNTTYEEFYIERFSVPHDSADPCGYVLTLEDGRKMAFCTDLGCVTQQVRSAVLGADLVVLESNYDCAMLDCGRYPYFLKRRIRGEKGHLSNEDCAAFALELLENGTTRFLLGHLSRENNLPELAYRTSIETLCSRGGAQGKDFILSVLPRMQPSYMTVL